MLKSEIKYLAKLMNFNIRDHPYLVLEGTRGKWKFKDHRTSEDDEEIPHVYPIGVSQYSIYVINPFNGEITSHGFNATDDYAGHKSQGYIVEPIKSYPPSYEGIKTIQRQIQGYMKLDSKYKIYKRWYS